LLDGALSSEELTPCQAGVEEYIASADPKAPLWAFNKDLEALCFHRSFWPAVMELLNGKVQYYNST
jgi:hypothetical protein